MSFITVIPAQMPQAFETGPALIWAILAIFLVATLALVGAAVTAERHAPGSAQPRGRARLLSLPGAQRPEEPPLAA